MFKATPWRLTAVAVFLLFACLFFAGCANPGMQTSNQNAATKADLLSFYAVPFT